MFHLLILVLRIILQETSTNLNSMQDSRFLAKKLHIIFHPSNPSHNSTQNTLKIALSTLETGPKLDWTRDNQMFECYRIWKKKFFRRIHFLFSSCRCYTQTTSVLPEVLDG